ncbi:uncharacterized protein METZ01_LOCUS15332, partial [marine metagenome]
MQHAPLILFQSANSIISETASIP